MHCFSFLLYWFVASPVLHSFPHDALPISRVMSMIFVPGVSPMYSSARRLDWRLFSSGMASGSGTTPFPTRTSRSEEHTSELQSRFDLVCRLLLEKKNDHPLQLYVKRLR